MDDASIDPLTNSIDDTLRVKIGSYSVSSVLSATNYSITIMVYQAVKVTS